MRFIIICLLFLFINNFSYTQRLSQVDSLLRIKYPTTNDDGWHYIPKTANLVKLHKPELSKSIPHLRYFRVKLTHTLSYHEDESQCLIVYDSRSKSVALIEPLWYSGESIKFLKRFEGLVLKDSNALKRTIVELQGLLKSDEDFSEKNTKYNSGVVTFDIFQRDMPGRTRHYQITVDNFIIKEIKYQ
jgi:hypothetical protein